MRLWEFECLVASSRPFLGGMLPPLGMRCAGTIVSPSRRRSGNSSQTA